MNSRFFPRYKIKKDLFDLFFLGNDPSVLPDILEVVDVSLSGIKIKVNSCDPHFTGSKVCIKLNKHTLYFQSRVIWNEQVSQDEAIIGLKLLIPTAETFQKWLTIIQMIDKGFSKERNQVIKDEVNQITRDSEVRHASSYSQRDS